MFFLFLIKCLADDDIFSEFLIIGHNQVNRHYTYKILYILFVLSLGIFFIFKGSKYHHTSLSILFSIQLIQIIIRVLEMSSHIKCSRKLRRLSKNIKSNGFYILGVYLSSLLVGILLLISSAYTSIIPVSLLIYHTLVSYYIESFHFVFKFLTYLLLTVCTYYYREYLLELIFVWYGSFAILILIKLLVFDPLNIDIHLRTSERFNFRKDYRLILVFVTIFFLNICFQILILENAKFMKLMGLFN